MKKAPRRSAKAKPKAKPPQPAAQAEPEPKKPLSLPATLAAIARALGYNERTLQRAREADLITPLKAGVGNRPAIYDLVAIARALIGRPDDPRKARDHAQAEWLQLRIAKERGELLPAAEVSRAGRGLVSVSQAKLMFLGDDLVRLGVIPAKRQPEVDAMVREALESLAELTSISEAA